MEKPPVVETTPKRWQTGTVEFLCWMPQNYSQSSCHHWLKITLITTQLILFYLLFPPFWSCTDQAHEVVMFSRLWNKLTTHCHEKVASKILAALIDQNTGDPPTTPKDTSWFQSIAQAHLVALDCPNIYPCHASTLSFAFFGHCNCNPVQLIENVVSAVLSRIQHSLDLTVNGALKTHRKWHSLLLSFFD